MSAILGRFSEAYELAEFETLPLGLYTSLTAFRLSSALSHAFTALGTATRFECESRTRACTRTASSLAIGDMGLCTPGFQDGYSQ